MSFVDSYGTQIWFLLNSDTERIKIDVSDYDSDKILKYDFEVVNSFNLEEFPYTVLLDDLRPDKEYIVFCGVGGQGTLATKTMKDMGVKNVKNITGGIKEWEKIK